jgi:hypothetical protein
MAGGKIGATRSFASGNAAFATSSLCGVLEKDFS